MKEPSLIDPNILKYTDEPIGDLKVVPDFLPQPDDLVIKNEDGAHNKDSSNDSAPPQN